MKNIVRGHMRRIGNKKVVVRPHIRNPKPNMNLKKIVDNLDWKDSIDFLLDLELKYYRSLTGKQILTENYDYYDYDWLEEKGFINKEGEILPIVNTKESKNILLQEYIDVENSYLRDDSIEELHERIFYMINTLKRKKMKFNDILKYKS